MAQGLPVIAREISGLTEALGSAGVLVPECAPGPWAEVLDGLVEDPRWCADLARRSRARAATLTWAETATRTHAAYVEACGD
jgi:glycosyltransferase involved in cell wall biosynthesis